MAKLKFELFMTFADQQLTIEVSDKPILFGCSSECQVKIGNDEPSVKALIEKQGEHLNVKIFDINFPVMINGKQYKSAKIKKSAFFKIGDVDIISTIEEVTEEQFTTSTVEDENQNLPTFVDDDVTNSDVIPNFLKTELEEKRSQNLLEGTRELQLTQSLNQDDFQFNINFTQVNSVIPSEQVYAEKKWDYSDYIDLRDETVKELPVPEIHQAKETQSYHITHMNNGVVISDGFYSTKQKIIYMSNSIHNKNHVQIHECGGKKFDFIQFDSGKPKVIRIGGYSLNKVLHHNVSKIEESSADLIEGQKLVLSKGTSQIMIELSLTPPTIKTNRFLNIDEELLRAVAFSWLPILFFIGTVVFMPPKEQTEVIKEKVVLLKRQKNKPEVIKPEPVKVAVAEAEAPPLPKEIKQMKETPPPPKKTPVAKISPPKLAPAIKKPEPIKKVVEARKESPPKIMKAKTVEVAKRAAPAPEPKKQYKFSFGKNLASKVNSVSDTNLKVAESEVRADIANAVSSSTSQSNNLAESKSFGVTNTKVARFAATGRSGASTKVGASGLSGKSRSVTAYIEANTKILGAIDPDLIRKLMREYIPEFRRCYQRELLKNSTVAGVFDLAFQINSQGKGTSVNVKSHGESFSSKGKECITRVVSLINFPKPKGGGQVDVKQPMNFYNQ